MNINPFDFKSTASRISVARRSPVTTLLAGAMLATALFAGPGIAYVATEIDVPVVADTSELEPTFWACDYAATMHGVDLQAAVLCGSVTEELKIKRFGGSFERMLEWWAANRTEQYAALRRVLAEQASGSEARVELPESI